MSRRMGVSRGARRSLALVSALMLLGSAASARAETLVTRHFFAHEEAFLVPQGVTGIQVVAIGGHGGANAHGIPGGQGARVTGSFSVTPGEMLYVHVGGSGANGEVSGLAGEGGGASDVRTAPMSAGLAPDPRLIVAGAGGGAGGVDKEHGPEPNEGNGGNAEESGGSVRGVTPGGEGAEGASPGAAYQGECRNGGRPAQGGEIEKGGEGATCEEGPFGLYYAGSGGAGYYGGGGGGAHGDFAGLKYTEQAGGGGGSSLVPTGGTKALAGNETPQVEITYAQPPNPPAVATGHATGVRAFSATISGTVNPEDDEVTSCTFEYGTSESYGTTVACPTAPGAGIAPVAESLGVSGLERATTYDYRITATNATGTSYGSNGSFTTLPQEPPTVTGIEPTEGPLVGGTKVTITGTELENATAVTFGSQPAASFAVASPTTITAVSPEGTGVVEVSVTTPGGAAASGSIHRFTYVGPPSATTLPGSAITSASATLNASVSSAGRYTDCHFDYGKSLAYEKTAPCSPTPQPGASSASAVVGALEGNTTYHFRVSVSNVAGAKLGGDRTFTTEEAPEYGRCIKVTAGAGTYATGTCTTTTAKAYEWYPAFGDGEPLVKTRFTTKLKETTTVTFQAKSGRVITCKGETSGGEYTGKKTIGNIVMTFTGCALTGTGSCESGATEGTVVTSALEGALGVIKKSTEGPLKNTIGTDLKPVSGNVIASFNCAGTAVTVSGSAIAEVVKNVMGSKETLKLAQAKGVQRPSRFEGSPEETPTITIGTQPPSPLGIAMTTFQLDEEKVEVNSVV